ncbi:oxidoreductase [Streptomyces venezuelae]|uniref:Oxidoreductase n=1 Tax=Streptomyces venezuelae TaxID=54571 RepID=A0A5P2D194_STRVZ|nr:SDR family NAD(P)-dependent oxidoreductase [Streptomyces venezuelae]QES46889.1 oxidoreductase [Streptomyces venezuelae]
MDSTQTRRPLAVVTGGSSGIGFELAREFAEHGYDLVIAAEDPGLHDAAARLRAHGGAVRAVRCDLATFDGVETLYGDLHARGRPVDVAVLNAGVGQGGGFLETEFADQARVIDLNISSTVHLARRLLPEMTERGQGRMMITSSASAGRPGPFHAVQCASEAFLRSFSLALNSELKDKGVTVTALLPGTTDSRFFVRAGLLNTRLGRSRKDSPALVARQGFAALMAERPRRVAGSKRTRLEDLLGRLLPERARTALDHRWAEPGGGVHRL